MSYLSAEHRTWVKIFLVAGIVAVVGYLCNKHFKIILGAKE